MDRQRVGERIAVFFMTIAMVIAFPYIITMLLNGRATDCEQQLKEIHTGRDVIVQCEGKNTLMDVEQYIVGVLPGFVNDATKPDVIRAQAVALRTKIYFEMGNDTVIDSKKLGMTYYSDADYASKYGSKSYRQTKRAYEQAVLDTLQETIE